MTTREKIDSIYGQSVISWVDVVRGDGSRDRLPGMVNVCDAVAFVRSFFGGSTEFTSIELFGDMGFRVKFSIKEKSYSDIKVMTRGEGYWCIAPQNATIGQRGDTTVREITTVPDWIDPQDFLRLVGLTAFVPAYSPYSLPYSDLGEGKIISTYPDRIG